MHDAWTKGHFIMSLVTGLAPLPEEFFGLIIWEMPVSRDEISETTKMVLNINLYR